MLWVEISISARKPCDFPAKEVAKPNKSERRILKLSCYTCETIKNVAVHLACLEMRVARLNFNLICTVTYLDWDFPCHATMIGDLKLHETGIKIRPGSLGQLIGQVLIRSGVSEFDNFLLHFRVWPQAFKAWFCI